MNVRFSFASRKWLTVAGVLAVLAGSTAVQAADGGWTAVAAKFPVWMNGKQLKADKEPVVIDGSLYLPLRAFGEAVGKQIDWNDWNQSVTLKDMPVVKSKAELKKPAPLGKGIDEGGFSGLTHLPGDPADVFYTLGDRGPNGQIGKDQLRTFPIADFNPRIYKIKAAGDELQIVDTIKLKLPDGKTDVVTKSPYLTGLSNVQGPDEVPYDELGRTVLPYDPDGLDLEGITYSAADDTFWLSDEYRPSLVQIKRDGTVLGRYVPEGAKDLLKGAQTNIVEAFPAVYNNRISNRGFEGVTISPSGKYLFVSIQSPMAVPDKKTGEASRSMRILKMDLASKKVVGEFVYVAENAAQFTGVKQKDIVISDLHAVSDDVVLVDERDKNAGNEAQIKCVYKASFAGATSIFGTGASDKLEAMSVAQLRENGIVPVGKELVVDFVKLGYPYEKIEGLTVLDKRTLAIVNDNDYQVNYDDNVKLVPTGVPTQMWTVTVQEDLY